MNYSLLDSSNQDVSNGGKFISLSMQIVYILSFTVHVYSSPIGTRNMNLPLIRRAVDRPSMTTGWLNFAIFF